MSNTAIAIENGRKLKRKSMLRPVPRHVTAIGYTIATLFALSTIFPLLLVISSSFSSQDAIIDYGYGLWPKEFSLEGYNYIWKNINQILNAYGITIGVTVCGTLYGLTIMFMYAYVLSRPSFPWKTFTTLFSGGMLANYLVITTMYHLQDTFWVLFVPLGVSCMHIVIMRTYMTTNIPNEVIESAQIDGASEFTCLIKIIIPMAVPVIATIALFLVVMFWNEWMKSFLYIFQNKQLVPIQLLIKRIEDDIKYLASNANALGSAAMEMQSTVPVDSFRMGLVIIAILPMLIAYPFFQKYFMTGLTIGSVKG